MFDCVQFPRRGWVHRNRLPLASGENDWLTLPIEKAPRDAVISDLQFAPDARLRLASSSRRFPLFERALREADPLAQQILAIDSADVTAYLIALVTATAARLGMSRPIVRSSSLPTAPELHAQDRVIAILKQLGAQSYVNPSGGRALYDHGAFDAAGIALGFLTPYSGPMESIFARLLNAPSSAVADEIQRETIVAA